MSREAASSKCGHCSSPSHLLKAYLMSHPCRLPLDSQCVGVQKDLKQIQDKHAMKVDVTEGKGKVG